MIFVVRWDFFNYYSFYNGDEDMLVNKERVKVIFWKWIGMNKYKVNIIQFFLLRMLPSTFFLFTFVMRLHMGPALI